MNIVHGGRYSPMPQPQTRKRLLSPCLKDRGFTARLIKELSLFPPIRARKLLLQWAQENVAAEYDWLEP